MIPRVNKEQLEVAVRDGYLASIETQTWEIFMRRSITIRTELAGQCEISHQGCEDGHVLSSSKLSNDMM